MYHPNITLALACIPAFNDRPVVNRLRQQANIRSFYLLSQERTYLAQEYDLRRFLSSDLFVIDNPTGEVDFLSSLFLLIAMVKRKPIIITHDLHFSKNTSLFVREVATKRLNKLLLCDLNQLDDVDMDQFITTVASQPVNYVLTKHEETILRSLIRLYFRQLLLSKRSMI